MNKRISRFLVGAAIFSVVFMLSLFNINTFWCPTISSATTGKGNFRVNIEENISVAIESDMTDFEITPTPSGKFSSSNMIVRVYTNAHGYKLYFSEADASQKSNRNTPITSIFSALTGETPADSFPINSWGYSIDNTTYNAIPDIATPVLIKEVADLADEDSSRQNNPKSVAQSLTSIYFGAKANTEVPSGVYTDTVLFTVTTLNVPVETRTLADVAYMQEVTPKICQNTEYNPNTETTVDLIDNRDGKHYFVTKQADGNCFMTQNLDLDLKVGTDGKTMGTNGVDGDFVAFTNQNTNISDSNWIVDRPNAAYDTQTTTDTAWDQLGRNGSSNSNTYEVRSYDNGDNCLTYSGVKESTDTFASCTDVKTSANHAHAGNFYNFPAALAGGWIYGTAAQYANITTDICPKGWHIPTGPQSSSQGGERNTMLSTAIPAITINGGADTSTSMTEDIMTKMTSSPLYLARSGYYSYSNGSLIARGTSGIYWSSTPYNYPVFYLLFYPSYVYPGTRTLSAGYGNSVRCLIK